MKKNYLTKTAALMLFSLCASGASANLQINEVMQSNVHGIMDDLNEFPDSWVELYNNGAEAVNLAEYGLSVKDKASKAYKLPAVTLAPGEYVVVYCDKVGSGLHADFRVDSGKSELFLWHNGEKAETLSLAKMPAPDISYGRVSEKSDEWGYQAQATPGVANSGKIVTEILPEPVFSVKGGIKTASLSLILNKPADAPAAAVIRYTLDGSVPTTASQAYSKPISVKNNTIVRAALFADGYMTPLPTTQSYIFHPREMTLPIVSLAGNPEYFYDDKIGILTEGTYTEGTPNYMYDWRRPVNVEYFESDGAQVINQVIETRIKGGSSRNKPLRSMVLYANKRFVTKRLNHEFFPEHKPGLTDFKSVELRNAGQDFHELYQRDALCQTLIGMNTDMDWQAYQPVVLYVNGEYKGMLNMRERSNEDHIYTNYNGLEDVDVIENWGEVKEGSKDLYDQFYKFFNEEGHTLDEYSQQVDISEFMNLMVAASIFCHIDFPSNNIIMWRPTAEDGKWRWIAKDFDVCLGFNPQKSDLAYISWLYDPDLEPNLLHGNRPWATLLYRRLMEFEPVKDMFIDRILVYMGDFMKPSCLYNQLCANEEKMAVEHKAHRELYDIDWDWSSFEKRSEYVNNWYTNRVEFMYNHAADFFKYKSCVPLQIEIPEDTKVFINDIELKSDIFDGKWFPGRKLTATATMPAGDIAVVGWKVTTTNNDKSETETTYSTPTLELTFPSAAAVKIEPIKGPSALEDIEAEPVEATVEWFDLQGRSLGNTRPAPGIYIRKAGKHVTKTVVR